MMPQNLLQQGMLPMPQMMPMMGQGPQAFPMMPATQHMMMPAQVPNILPMMSPQMMQGSMTSNPGWWNVPEMMASVASTGSWTMPTTSKAEVKGKSKGEQKGKTKQEPAKA